jgi:hypothetical protein
VVNLSERPVGLHTVVPPPTGSPPTLAEADQRSDVVLASGPLDGDRLPPDTTVWMLSD